MAMLANDLHQFCETMIDELSALLKSISDPREIQPKLSSYLRKAGVTLEEIISDSGASVESGMIVFADEPANPPAGVAQPVAEPQPANPEQVVAESWSYDQIAERYKVSLRTAQRRMQGVKPAITVERKPRFWIADVLNEFQDVSATQHAKPMDLDIQSDINTVAHSCGITPARLSAVIKALTNN